MGKLRMGAVVLGLAFAVALAACGSDGDDDAAPADATTDDTGATGGGAEVTVGLRETPLGDVLVDAQGMTLYLFTNDSENRSACSGNCAMTWPPLAPDGELIAGPGVDQSKLSVIDREDGSKQVAYAGKPLYFYAPDEKPGDTKGQGVGGVWYVVGADGEAITEAESASISY